MMELSPTGSGESAEHVDVTGVGTGESETDRPE